MNHLFRFQRMHQLVLTPAMLLVALLLLTALTACGGDGADTSEDAGPTERASQERETREEGSEPEPTEVREAEPVPTEAGEAEPVPTEAGEAEPVPTEAGEAEPETEAGEAEPVPDEAEPVPTEAGEAEPEPNVTRSLRYNATDGENWDNNLILQRRLTLKGSNPFPAMGQLARQLRPRSHYISANQPPNFSRCNTNWLSDEPLNNADTDGNGRMTLRWISQKTS